MALPAPVNDATTTLDDLRLESDKSLARAGFALLLIPSIWFLRTDFQLYGNDWPRLRERLLLRGVLLATPVLGLLVLQMLVRTRDGYSKAMVWLGVLMGACILGLNISRPVGSGLPIRSPLYTLCMLYFAMPNSLWRQSFAPLALSAGLIGLRLTRLTGGGIDAGGDVVAIVVLNLLGMLTVSRRIRLEAATSDVVGELKTLRGIIPICSHCRKLRSEVGDWQQIERYFHEHSDALFSHGICPDCLREHYPNPPKPR